jgi:hypothetical protein
MRIAVIGTGIAGNAAAWALSTGSSHEVVLYEKDDRIGGHSATVDVDYDGVTIPVDTGFIVYNELNYPNLTALFAHLGVETEASDMGFAVSSQDGRLEWAGRATGLLNGLFARRRNIVSPAHLNMVREMFRFNKAALEDRAAGRLTSESIGAYLDRGGYSRRFREEYLVPMGAAIWSMPPRALVDFPADSFIAFFDNHRLLHWNRPVWRTVTGGSRRYVETLTAPIRDRIRKGVGVTEILRHDLGVTVTDTTGHRERFDQVIIAAHSDQALAMLKDANDLERGVLAGIPYRDNDVWLHRDAALMPKRRAAWAAWNVLQNDNGEEITLTYWMNALQNIDQRFPLFLRPPAIPHRRERGAKGAARDPGAQPRLVLRRLDRLRLPRGWPDQRPQRGGGARRRDPMARGRAPVCHGGRMSGSMARMMAQTATAQHAPPPTGGFPPLQGAAWLFPGDVMHARMKPKPHRFAYKVFNLLIDVDRLTEAGGLSRLFSVNRFNLLGFHEKDHGAGFGSLRAHVDALLEPTGVDASGGRVWLLCYPRVLGFVFNPISVYFVHDRADALAALIYEVRNTFGEMHTYVCRVEPGQASAAGVRQERDKVFYVSPFMDMPMRYFFRIRPPGETVAVRIIEKDAAGPILSATFHGVREALTSASVLRLCLAMPFLTLKVVAGIHWEAAKLWFKGIEFFNRPTPPAPVSHADPGRPPPSLSAPESPETHLSLHTPMTASTR